MRQALQPALIHDSSMNLLRLLLPKVMRIVKFHSFASLPCSLFHSIVLNQALLQLIDQQDDLAYAFGTVEVCELRWGNLLQIFITSCRHVLEAWNRP